MGRKDCERVVPIRIGAVLPATVASGGCLALTQGIVV